MSANAPPLAEWRTLARGMRGPDVAAWQRVLMRAGYSLAPWRDDGDYGPLTEKRTIQFQMDHALPPDGVVGPTVRAQIATSDLGAELDPERTPILQPVPEGMFLQAQHWTYANRRSVRLIVIHTMETSETNDTAEAVAAWFAGHRGPAPKASAHVCVDADSLVRCVHPQHIAWAAPGANRDGYQIELAGRARQTAAEWADAFSTRMLDIAARHVAPLCEEHGIALRKLTVAEVAGGKAKGFCGHHDVTLAFRKSDHTDPGPAFPWATFLARVADMTPQGASV